MNQFPFWVTIKPDTLPEWAEIVLLAETIVAFFILLIVVIKGARND